MRRLFLWTVILTMSILMVAVFSLSGCKAEEAAPAEEEAAEEAAPAEEEAAEEAAPAEEVEISFQYIGGTVPNVDGIINDAIAAFEDLNPNVTVKTIYVDWGNAHSQFMNSVAAGMAPDIGMLAGTWAVEFVESGALADISPYVSQEVLDTFIPSGFAAMTDAEGNIYGIPWDGCSWGLFYRTDLFEKAGLKAPPQSWEELVEYGQLLSDGTTSGLMMSALGWEPDDNFLPFLWQAGANVCKLEDGKWIGTFDTPEAKEAVQFYYDLVNKYGIMPQTITGMDWEAVMNSFIAGDTAMMVNGMWVIGMILNNHPELDGKWATALNPAGPGGIAALSYPNTMHISQQCKNKEVAGQFLDFFYSEGYYDEYCIQCGVFPFTKDFVNSDYAQDEFLKPFIELASYGKNRPASSKYEEFRQLFFNPGIQSLIADEITVDDFCEQMNEAFNLLHQ